MYVTVSVDLFVHRCRGQRMLLVIFLTHSLPYFLR